MGFNLQLTAVSLLILSSCLLPEGEKGRYSPVHEDPEVDNWNYPAALKAVQIESADLQLNGVFFQAQGEGLHPTILLLHGFPGYENNFDLAHIFMRAGYNVLVFHYRGAWGSPGMFTFTHAVEDAFTAMDFLKDPANAGEYRIDTASIIPVGHSMGGFVALYLASKDDRITAAASVAGFNFGAHAEVIRNDRKAWEETVDGFRDALPPLNSPGAEELVKEYVKKGEEWNLKSQIPEKGLCSLLLLAGSRDNVAPPSLHHSPLVEILKNRRANRLQSDILETDHGFANRRVELAERMLEWLRRID